MCGAHGFRHRAVHPPSSQRFRTHRSTVYRRQRLRSHAPGVYKKPKRKERVPATSEVISRFHSHSDTYSVLDVTRYGAITAYFVHNILFITKLINTINRYPSSVPVCWTSVISKV